ncbi:hypothetical protein Avbf_17106 [Armadillidium vulgare]|nr:hypothetical protein Avbf_17106 [Armadillidium vulgare]
MNSSIFNFFLILII